MKNLFKGKLGTVLILLATLVLAGVAVFTAVRLYDLRNQSVAPNVPSSIPHAQEVSTCSLSFSLTTSTSTPTETPTTTPTPTGSSTPTETPTPTGTPNSCNGTCGSNFNCQGGLMCYQGFCRNPSCTTDSSCGCGGTSTPTSTPTGTSTPTPTQPALPNTGVDWPTIGGFGVGIFVIIGSMLLAL